MATCKKCGEEDAEFVIMKVDGKRMKLCEQCAEDCELDLEIAEASEAAVQQMMGFKGRR